MRRELRLVEVGHEHAHPCGDERLGDGEADPARRAGHDRVAPLQLLHPGHAFPLGCASFCSAKGSDPFQIWNTSLPFAARRGHERGRARSASAAADVA